MTTRLVAAWTRYWFRPTPTLDLAGARIVIVGMALYLLLPPEGDLGRLRDLSLLPDQLYDPLPVLHLLVAPIGWTYRPGFEVLEAVYWVAVAGGVTALIGLFTNVSLLVFAWANVFLQAFKYSFGEFHHPEGVMMIGLVVLALSPSGRALSVDAWVRRRRRGGAGVAEAGPTEATSSLARWPLLVIRWVLALAYFSAAFHKLRVAGFDWMNGHTLQYYILRDADRWAAPLGLWVGQHYPLILALSVVTMLWEGTFFLVLVFPVLAWIYVPLGLGFHAGTWLTMRAGFFQFMALYAAFVPWSAAYRWCVEKLPFRRQSTAGLTARST